MPLRLQVDAPKLIAMVRSGKPQAEIMTEMGFKTSSQVRIAYLKALVEAGQAPEIVRGRKRKVTTVKPVNTTVSVGKRGSIVLPKALVESLGIDTEGQYQVKKRKDNITLKKVG